MKVGLKLRQGGAKTACRWGWDGDFCNRLKALLWEPDGFVLLYKRLDNGRYQWPRNAQEVKPLTWEQFTWLMQGLNIEQPRAIRPGRPKKLV